MINNYDKKNAQIARIAFLYYKQNKSQQEISELLSIARPTVSKFISEAKELSLVDFKIKYPWRIKELENKIVDTFKIDKAIVIETSDTSRDIILKELGISAANYVSPIFEKVKDVSISWGQALYNMIEELKCYNSSVDNVIQMIGATGDENNPYDGPLLAQYLSKKLNCNCLMLHAPLVVGSESIAKSLMKDNNIKNVLGKAAKVDIAFVGIGCVKIEYNSLYKTGYIDKNELNLIIDSGAVGDICGHYYDKNGKELDININSKIVGMGLNDIKKIKNVVAVAGGEIKAQAVYSALIGKYINILIIDSKLAKQILMMTGI